MVRTEKGFTLTELLVTVGILAVVAVFAMPNFNSWLRNSTYREAAQKIVTAMHQARNLAISKNLPYRVVIDLAAQRYSLQEGTWPGPAWPLATKAEWINLPASVMVKGDDSDPHDLDCEVTTDTDYDVIFLPNGTTMGLINVCVMASSKPDTPLFQVAVETPMTGRAFVKD